jgi:diadenosine tetraphosphate (Ap4A) HIT family hydrolase
MASLHPQLQKDCLILGRFELSHLLLLNDSNYPWFILVPDRADISEIYELSESDRNHLWQESNTLSSHLMQRFAGDKLNIGAIGNLVPQLHVHHIVRYRSDLAWPAPVWGRTVAEPYSDEALSKRIEQVNLAELASFQPL